MRIGILGSGGVARTLALRLTDLGHSVAVGSRDPGRPELTAWASASGGATVATAAEAVSGADLVVNATAGLASEAVVSSVADGLAGRTLLDLSNPLDFTGGFPPVVVHRDGVSLAERLQAAAPATAVVKALNMVTAEVMLDPGRLGEPTLACLAGDDDAAKATVADLLRSAGWQDEQIVDLGALSAARGMEQYLPLWLSLFGSLGTAAFNLRLVR